MSDKFNGAIYHIKNAPEGFKGAIYHVKWVDGQGSHNLGYYATPAALEEAWPTAEAGDFALVGSTDTIWAWDADESEWVDTDKKGQVVSVNNKTGEVVLTASDVGAATAAQGAKADTAIQPSDLGTAAYAATTDFATAAQGAKADTAIQSVKTINGQTITGSGNVELSTYLPYPAGWTTNGTTKTFCDDIAADTSAVAGKAYLGEVTLSDLPASMANGEIVVEIMNGTTAQNKVIILTLKSGNVSPYCWQYTYWDGGSSVSGWKSLGGDALPSQSGHSGEFLMTNGSTALWGAIPSVQVSSMPTASSSNVGDVVQYVGASSQDYTNGYFYKCNEVSLPGGIAVEETVGTGMSSLTVDADRFTEKFSPSGTGSVDFIAVASGGYSLSPSSFEFGGVSAETDAEVFFQWMRDESISEWGAASPSSRTELFFDADTQEFTITVINSQNEAIYTNVYDDPTIFGVNFSDWPEDSDFIILQPLLSYFPVWELDGSSVSLPDYGIYYMGFSGAGDTITVSYSEETQGYNWQRIDVQPLQVIPQPPVTSVNDKTGDVHLDAYDVGAVAQYLTLPDPNMYTNKIVQSSNDGYFYRSTIVNLPPDISIEQVHGSDLSNLSVDLETFANYTGLGIETYMYFLYDYSGTGVFNQSQSYTPNFSVSIDPVVYIEACNNNGWVYSSVYIGNTDSQMADGYWFFGLNSDTVYASDLKISDLASNYGITITNVDPSATYEPALFEFEPTNVWMNEGNVVDLTDYGISYSGTPAVEDELMVYFNPHPYTYEWKQWDAQPSGLKQYVFSDLFGNNFPDTVPSADDVEEGTFIQFVGKSDFFTNGYFYRSIPYGQPTQAVLDSVPAGLSVTIDASVFGTQVSFNGKYFFSYNNGEWVFYHGEYPYSAVDLNDYGITVSGTPSNGDWIIVSCVPGTSNRHWEQTDVQPGAQPVVPSTMPTLAVADWDAITQEQTVSVTGVTTNNVVFVSPAPASAADYATAGIVCTAQGSGTLTFACSTIPSNAITVNVVIM